MEEVCVYMREMARDIPCVWRFMIAATGGYSEFVVGSVAKRPFIYLPSTIHFQGIGGLGGGVRPPPRTVVPSFQAQSVVLVSPACSVQPPFSSISCSIFLVEWFFPSFLLYRESLFFFFLKYFLLS